MRTCLALASACSLAVAACGGDDGGTPAVDAAVTVDAPAGPVAVVACAGVTADATVTAPGFAFMPASTSITAGQVVKFTMPATHNAKSDTNLWTADFSTDTCVRFTTAGTYPFHCEPHLFTGTIVVQ
ncbi:MAG: hypothetical protein R3B06_24320 [Kofleriaceae bacterium]